MKFTLKSPCRNDSVLEEILRLMRKSAVHAIWSVDDICRFILPPLEMDRFRLITDSDQRIVGFITWAFFTEEIERAFLGRTRLFEAQDWSISANSGQLWIIDLIAPDLEFIHVARTLQDFFLANYSQTHDSMSFVRRIPGGGMRKLVKWKKEDFGQLLKNMPPRI